MPKPPIPFPTQTRLTEEQLENVRAELGAERYQPFKAVLEAEALTQEAIQKLGATVKKLKPLLDEDTFDELQMDFDEVEDDFKFMNSERGKYVVAIHNWYEPFRKEFNAMPEFSNVVIGGHSERQIVYATGVVATQADFEKLLAYIEKKNPPFPLETNVRLGTSKGPKAER